MFVVIGIKPFDRGEDELLRTENYSEAAERTLITPLNETYVAYRILWMVEE